MGFKINSGTLTTQNAIANYSHTPYMKDIEYNSSIYEALQYMEEIDTIRINEACNNYKFILMSALNEADKEAVADRIIEVFRSIGKTIGTVLDFLMAKYGNRAVANVQLNGLEQDLKNVDKSKRFNLNEYMIVIEHPDGALEKAFSDILGMLTNCAEEMDQLAESNVPSEATIKAEEDKLNTIMGRDSKNKSYADKVYNTLGITIINKDKTRSFVTEKVLFTNSNFNIIIAPRIKLLRRIVEQFQKVAGIANTQRKKVDRCINRIKRKDEPSEHMIRYMSLVQRKVNYTYSTLLKTSRMLSIFTSAEVRNIRLVLDKMLGYRNEASIHGEDFNSDTLFETLSIEDFNPTEWMDISLAEGEYDFNRIRREAYREAYLRECQMYLSEQGPSIERLIQINEANDQKQDNAYETLWKAMQGVVEKAINDMASFFNQDKKWLAQYKILILDASKRVDALIGSKTNGYIFKGLDSLLKFEYPEFDYNPNDTSKYKDVNTYLLSLIQDKKVFPTDGYDVTKLNSNDWQNNPSGFIRAYFGSKFTKPGDNSPAEITLGEDDFNEKNLNRMYNVLSNYAIMKNKMKKNFDTAKKNSKSKDNTPASQAQPTNQQPQQAGQTQTPANSGGQTQATNGNGSADASSNQQGLNAAAYSFVYDRYIHEVEFNDSNNNNQQNGGNTQNTGNAGQPNAKTAAKDDAFNKCKKVYIQAMHTIMKIQLTAFSYIRNEYRQIVAKKVSTLDTDAKIPQLRREANKA